MRPLLSDWVSFPTSGVMPSFPASRLLLVHRACLCKMEKDIPSGETQPTLRCVAWRCSPPLISWASTVQSAQLHVTVWEKDMLTVMCELHCNRILALVLHLGRVRLLGNHTLCKDRNWITFQPNERSWRQIWARRADIQHQDVYVRQGLGGSAVVRWF